MVVAPETIIYSTGTNSSQTHVEVVEDVILDTETYIFGCGEQTVGGKRRESSQFSDYCLDRIQITAVVVLAALERFVDLRERDVGAASL